MARRRFSAGRVPKLYGLNHVLGTGQSLSLGYEGDPALSTSQPFANKMFADGTSAESFDSLAPLIEGVKPVDLETPSSGFANLVTQLAGAIGITHDALLSLHGMSGTPYVGVKKGNDNYTRGMAQVTNGMARAAELGKTYGVTAVTCVHGETDALEYNGSGSGPNPHYESDLVEWQRDYETDINAITGQTGTIPMFHSQLSRYIDNDVPLAQLRAHENNPGKIVLIGPKYHLIYTGVLGLHMTNESYRQLGEEFARAYYQHVILGRPWEPLRPIAYANSGNQITLTMHVPSPPMVLDTVLMGAQPNYGFRYTPAGGGGETITAVEIVSADQVRITLSGSPVTWGTIEYGVQTTKGNLRDSDDWPSRHGYTLHNWCCIFSKALT